MNGVLLSAILIFTIAHFGYAVLKMARGFAKAKAAMHEALKNQTSDELDQDLSKTRSVR